MTSRRGSSPNRLGVLISGRGSNLVAILDRIRTGDLDAEVVLVVSNEPEAPGLRAARSRGVETLVVDHRASASRAAHDRKMAEALEAREVSLVCLAGYMRLLSAAFVRRFKGRILNIHPALLPAFPGLGSQEAALAYGVKVTGCTVHFVDEGVDTGPIILQEPVAVLDGDTPESLAARILETEHRAYSRAIALFFSGRLRIVGRRVLGAAGPEAG
ncbi:MAG TPA: phosphoribosylglycinamide formyltransferase [Candidatus Polarisedimenticolia bacterium]|nr:phosphoribosylglycinamide formyltransferase [Candidatus Polarisedimenticolia bacterium]